MLRQFPPHTRDFINAVVNPFSADQPARVPDIERLQSVCFRDATELSATTNPFDGDISGLLIWISIGHNTMRQTYAPSAFSDQIYHIGYCGISDSGDPVFTVDGDYLAYESMNYNTITGAGASTTGDPIIGDALSQAFRFVSMGLRVLPAIEVVTDTSIPYVSYFISGQLTPYELGQWGADQTDIRATLKNSPYSEVYGNNEGTCNRYDPVQKANMFETLSLTKWNGAAYATDDYRTPTVACMFSQSIAANELVPVITHAQFWLECVLKQPTPIYASPSPVDPNFSKVISILSQSDDVFPLVSKGHSFVSFANKLPQFIRQSNEILRLGSSIFNEVRPVMRMAGRAFRGKRRKRKRKKRSLAPRKGRGRIGSAVPASVYTKVKN
jgi:hypothetical protein